MLLDGDVRSTMAFRETAAMIKQTAAWREAMERRVGSKMADSDQLAPARDGLVGRLSGPWAAEKLHYVEHYQAIFAKGMKGKWGSIGYVDMMAGPGRCIDRQTREEYDGSPVRSLSSPFTNRAFVELDPICAEALRARVDDPSSVIEGNCNDPAVIAAVRGRIPANALTLVFIDNLGLNCTFDTIAALTVNRRMDLMLTVMTNDFQRNARSGRVEDDARFTAFFGSDEWKTVVAGATRTSDVAADLLDHYGERLKTLNYPFICPARRVMKNSKQSGLYRLLLATRHERGEEFFRKIEKISLQGQREMWD